MQERREQGDYPQGLELIAAVIERARIDSDDISEHLCPIGEHKVWECASTLLFAIDTFAAQHVNVEPDEYALIFFQLVGESNGSERGNPF